MNGKGSVSKQNRVLEMHEMLLAGKILSKGLCAERYSVTEKSIQRDITELKNHFSSMQDGRELIYDRNACGYRLIHHADGKLSNSEVLAVCKIMLESRSMVKGEMFPILDKLIQNCTPAESLNQVKMLISNERFHYVEPHHGKAFTKCLWDLGEAIKEQRVIEIEYRKTHGGDTKHRRLHPVGLLFSEYYFYLAAFIEGIDREQFANPEDNSPTIYRVDRIENYKITKGTFSVIYANRFQEGEMRKRIQFMYGGSLTKLRFIYKGPNLEAVLDRLPTARVIDNGSSEPIIEAEVFNGNGLEMWIRSQGEYIQKISVSNK